MRILSIRSPWWWFILHAGKDIENRDWRWAPSYRGPLLIHASKTITKRDLEDDIDAAAEMWSVGGNNTCARSGLTLETFTAVAGCIVGQCDMVDVVTESASPWFVGSLGFVLRNAKPLVTPIPFKAALGLLEVPAAIRAQIQVAP